MKFKLVSTTFIIFMTCFILGFSLSSWADREKINVSNTAEQRQREGQAIFRFDTFGSEQLWTDVLRLHEVIATVDAATALAVGLKVDVDALPKELVAALQAGQVDLKKPEVTVELLRLNAVVGVKGSVDEVGRLATIGVTCALCHSSVDNSLAPGIGKRLDGWVNTDLNVGAIMALSPILDDATKAEFKAWGPGKFDPRRHYFDGINIIPLNSPSLPVVIPPVYGLKGVGFETYTADGPISYWNSYVGIGQMGGKGTFIDPRIGITIVQTPDLVASKLPALLDYQLSLKTPKPETGSFDRVAAQRGKHLFSNKANCATCHQPPHFTDVLSGPNQQEPFVHDPAEVGADPAYANRSATKKYRTTPLRGLQQHPPYFRDGSAADLLAVVNHYDKHFSLNLTKEEKADLVEYLKSI
ncbi:c-type cytochrome [Nitrosomonas communis]|uniref:Cytochrome c n=1 Tax=Nitrosomonas communis TaxID=44574 RepID=A0A1I4U703_9PROT|nr:c-type cytochrome [Nitrosomonas communis]SFM84665.1 Cytochrome c [Nitrosomonas communis]